MLFHFHIILICILITIASNPIAMSNNTAKLGCQPKCGNVTVPYPFGIGKNMGCSLNDMFYVNCSMSGEHPKLYLRSSDFEILNISDSELRIKNLVSYKCYGESGSVVEESSLNFGLSSFTFSEKNRLTVIGCDVYAFLVSRELRFNYSAGCLVSCTSTLDMPDGPCLGNGCCQTSIFNGSKNYTVTLDTFVNLTDVWSFNRCGYGFIGEKGSFQFRSGYVSSKPSEVVERIQSTVPIVIDWVIASNQTCKDHSNECKQHSSCYDVHGGGYRCRCNKGFKGNPYLDGGCLDIDECKDLETFPCYGECTNTIGDYLCICNRGSVGDPKIPNGCQLVGGKDSKTLKIIFTLGVVLGTVLMLVLASGIYKVVKKRKEKKLREKLFKRNGGLLLQQQITNGGDADERTRMFSARDLEKATDQYNVNRIVGRGGQGTVYKGMLTDGRIVAVKRSKLVDENQVESFINEVFLLSQIIHKNVVKLLGCCLETEVPILVYEFVPNGDLFQFIHDENYDFPTIWSMRLQIATEVAGALAYMHYATSIPIYHRDIKSSNILLDEKFRAKLSDFGISKSVIGDQTHLSTLVKGTHGYIDPEYFQSYQFTEISDVYSFGIVLVELLTGKKPIYSIGLGESRTLATLILSTEEGLLLENIDDRVLDGPKEQLIAVARLAKRCLNLNGKLRPTMKEVATKLEGIRSTH